MDVRPSPWETHQTCSGRLPDQKLSSSEVATQDGPQSGTRCGKLHRLLVATRALKARGRPLGPSGNSTLMLVPSREQGWDVEEPKRQRPKRPRNVQAPKHLRYLIDPVPC